MAALALPSFMFSFCSRIPSTSQENFTFVCCFFSSYLASSLLHSSPMDIPSAISLKRHRSLPRASSEGDKFPPSLMFPLSLKSTLRRGENPHQKTALYIDKSISLANASGIANAIQHHGKEMSYNNYLDAEAAWNYVSEFKNPTCVIIKHTNPCGVASWQDILKAYRLAIKVDPVSAYGSIVASTQ